MSDLTNLIQSRRKNALAVILMIITLFVLSYKLLEKQLSNFETIEHLFLIFSCLLMGRVFWQRTTKADAAVIAAATRARRSIEDRLDELERLKRRDLVTPEEYAANRQEILKEL